MNCCKRYLYVLFIFLFFVSCVIYPAIFVAWWKEWYNTRWSTDSWQSILISVSLWIPIGFLALLCVIHTINTCFNTVFNDCCKNCCKKKSIIPEGTMASDDIEMKVSNRV